MKQKHIWIVLILLLSVILAMLVFLAIMMLSIETPQLSNTTPGSTPPTQTTNSTISSGSTAATEPTHISTAPSEPTMPTQSIPTEPPVTTAPPVTTEPPATTEPAPPEIVGSLYTRQELEAMDSVAQSYGPGVTSGGKRPPYAQPAQDRYGQYGGNFIAPDDGNVYLTFDCGYEYTATDENGAPYRVTERILDVLKEKDVKAVFFITMSYAQNQPDLVQRMLDEGHAIGNHSVNHPNMPELSIDEMVAEVMGLHEYVLQHFGYEMTLFRPPAGTYSVQSLAVVQSLGYKNVHWSFAYADYYTDAQPAYDEAMDIVTGRHHSGAIYLLHAISVTNAEILSDVIDFFRNQGYTLVLFQ